MKNLTPERNLLLVGTMASGKTTQSKVLPALLNRRRFSTDDRIRERFGGLEINDIFRIHGEEKFRAMETEVVREALETPGFIIDCGGGTFFQKAPNPNRQLMIGLGVVLGFDVSFLELCRRMEGKTDRPKWSPNDMDANRRLYDERQQYLRQADHLVCIDEVLTEEQVTARVLQTLGIA